MQLELANAQADVAVKQARAAKDNAAAVAQAGGLQLGRAKFIHDVEKAGNGEAPASPLEGDGASGIQPAANGAAQ
jgi:hypothetical protein